MLIIFEHSLSVHLYTNIYIYLYLTLSRHLQQNIVENMKREVKSPKNHPTSWLIYILLKYIEGSLMGDQTLCAGKI